MKRLKPSHRERKRYILLEGRDATKQEIEQAVLDYIGILGFAKASLKIVKSGKNKAVIAVNRKELENIRASFLLSGKKIQVKRVSGSLKNFRNS